MLLRHTAFCVESQLCSFIRLYFYKVCIRGQGVHLYRVITLIPAKHGRSMLLSAFLPSCRTPGGSSSGLAGSERKPSRIPPQAGITHCVTQLPEYWSVLLGGCAACGPSPWATNTVRGLCVVEGAHTILKTSSGQTVRICGLA